MTGSRRPSGQGRSDGYSDVAATLQEIRGMEADSSEHAALRERAITRCLPLAEHLAMRFRGRGESAEDLIQVACVGLMNAIDRFDIDRGGDFVSFAVPTIMGEVRRYFRDSGWAMRVPRRMKELHLLISRATEVLSQRLGRAPSASELAHELGIGVQEVAEGLLAKGAYRTESMDATVSGEPGGVQMPEVLGEEDPSWRTSRTMWICSRCWRRCQAVSGGSCRCAFSVRWRKRRSPSGSACPQMHVPRILSRTLAGLRAQLARP